MPYEFHTRRRVEFAETDLAGIVHFANYFRWMEAAEHEFFRSFGSVCHGGVGTELRGYLRVKVECEYRAPVRYAEIVHTHLVVIHKSAHSLGYGLGFEVERDDGRLEVALGRMRVVCVGPNAQGELKALPLPDEVERELSLAPAALRRRFDPPA